MQRNDEFHWRNVEQKKPDANEYIQYLHEMQKTGKTKLEWWKSEFGEATETWKVGEGGLWGSGTVLQYLDLCGSYIYRNSSDYTFKSRVLYVIHTSS